MTSPRARVALITGGSRGIGLGIATLLAKEKWQLAINGVRPQHEIDDVLIDLRQQGVDVVYCRGDIGTDTGRADVMEAVRESFGRLDLLVNNAGISSPGRLDILEATEEAFDRVIDVNLKGAVFLAKAAALWMRDQRASDPHFSGCIINISSISAELASVNRGDYCISWACLSEATKILACSLAEHGIQVYEVRPGIIRTDMTKGVTEKYDRLISDGISIERRWGTPEDVAKTVAMLARGEISYCPGTVITVDGGVTLLQGMK